MSNNDGSGLSPMRRREETVGGGEASPLGAGGNESQWRYEIEAPSRFIFDPARYSVLIYKPGKRYPFVETNWNAMTRRGARRWAKKKIARLKDSESEKHDDQVVEEGYA